MEENVIFTDKPAAEAGGLRTHTALLVLGILSIVLGLLIALVGEILSITGIVLARKHRFTHKTKAALVCSIIGLVLSVLNQVLGILLLFA